MCDISEDKEKPARPKVGGDSMTALPLKAMMFLPQSKSFLSEYFEPFPLISTSLLYVIFLCQLLRPPQVAPEVKNLSAKAGDVGDMGSFAWWGRFLGGGHGNPLQYSSMENPMDRGAWWAAVHRLAELDTREANKHNNTR